MSRIHIRGFNLIVKVVMRMMVFPMMIVHTSTAIETEGRRMWIPPIAR